MRSRARDAAKVSPLPSGTLAWTARIAAMTVCLAMTSCGATPEEPGLTPQTASNTPAPPSSAPEPAPAVPKKPAFTVEPAFPNISFPRMVHLTYPDDGTERLFLTLQPGRVMVLRNEPNASSPKTFLDIRSRVNDRGNEEGLLGLAFDPQYRSNGYFYVYYSASPPRRSVLSRFSVSPDDPDRADPNSESIVLEVPQPYSNHNGGQILFGPDGYLYLGLGDGGRGGDPHGNGQDTSTLLGSILRIDVSAAAAEASYLIPSDNPFVGRGETFREEIWAYGLRNPWRFTFDAETGDMWTADVGQNRLEEIDVIEPGRNYGWNVMEGSRCYRTQTCNTEELELPIAEYGRTGGCSVTGGYVYRGSRLPSLQGAYIYGDFCSGKIWALWQQDGHVTENRLLIDSELTISSFGEDRDRELYILSFTGQIYRLAPR